jgi:fatty-acyl-CoA synthase
MVVEYRETDANKRRELTSRISRIIRTELGIDCTIELVSAHTLPRTSSGKLSRAGTLRDYLKRQAEQKVLRIEPWPADQGMSLDLPDLLLASSGL